MARRIIDIPSTERLRRSKSIIPNLLELYALGMMVHDDHFVGDLFKGGAAPGIYQSTASGAAAATAAIATGAVGGKIRLDPGTDNAGRSDLSLGLHYQGQLNAACWWRFTTPANVGSWKFELGFTDVVSGTDAGAVNSKSGNTFTATDAVALIRDTDDDTNLTLMAVKNGTAATAIDFSTALAAATDYYAGIVLEGTSARGFLLNASGKLLETTAWMANAVTADVLLTPWAFCQNRSASQRLLDLDRLLAYQLEATGA